VQVNAIDVQKHLKGMDYPATRDEVVAKAEENGAGDDIVEQLRSMSADRFTGPDDVMEALGRS
jgi:Protein of unknown function (DUF2795)